MDDHEVMVLRNLLDKVQIGGAGAVLLGKLLAGEILSLGEGLSTLLIDLLFESSKISRRADTDGETGRLRFVNGSSGT
jgi:hypothetical protein